MAAVVTPDLTVKPSQPGSAPAAASALSQGTVTPLASPSPNATDQSLVASATPVGTNPTPPASGTGTDTQPTVSQLYGSQGPLDTEAAKAGAADVAAYSPDTLSENQGQSRSDILAQYQGQIDALDQQAAQARASITAGFAPTELATERANAARTGNAGATSAARGLAGSAFGDALVGNAALANEADTRANAADLASKLQTSDQTFANQKLALNEFIQGEIDKETQLRQTASQQGADAKVKEIQDRTTRMQGIAQNSVKAMIMAGVTDPSNPNYSDTIKSISQATGLSQSEVEGMYQTTAQSIESANASIAESKAKSQTTLSPGQKLYDANGNEIASVPVANKYAGVAVTDMLGNQRVVVYDQTTGQFVGYTDQGSGGASSAGTGTGTGGSTAVTGSGSAMSGASTAPTPSGTSSTPADVLFGKNNDSQYASGTVQDALNALGIQGGATKVMQAAGVDPMAKLSDLPQAQRDALTNAVQQAGGFVNANPNAPFSEFGLLSKTNFDPNNTVDQLANLYLQQYIKNGTIPTPSTMGRNIKPGLMALVTSRAQDLYHTATGSSLPSPSTLQAQQDILANNYKLGNNLAIQESIVSKNVDLSLNNMTKNGLNSSGFLPLNDLIDNVKNALGDPNVAQLLSQNTTLQNEMGSLLAVKNASGTTVYDKLESAHLISPDMSPQQIQQVISTMMSEAKNFSSALANANATAYQFTDPLLQDPNNPARGTYLGGTNANSGTGDQSGAEGNGGSTGTGVDLSGLDFSIGQ